MGTDIHIEVFAKIKRPGEDGEDIVRIPPPPEWLWEDSNYYPNILTSLISFWPGFRCYAAFGLLAGVRGDDDPPYPPRGLPDFLLPHGKEVTYEGWKEIEYIWSERIGLDQFIDVRLNLGDHTHSWLTLDELKRIDWNYKYDDEKKTTPLWPATILIPMLEKIAAYRDVEEIYVVFGFDS